MTVDEAIDIALDRVEEWHYEDRGYDYSECTWCGWNSKEHRTPEIPMGHKPGCKLREALDVLSARPRHSEGE